MADCSPKTCVIILNWNGWVDTLECLDSLTKTDPAPTSIVVADNNSTDQSVAHIIEWAKKQFTDIVVLEENNAVPKKSTLSPPPFLLIKNPTNFGFSGGNNPAISWALQQDTFDFLWLLNNDTIVSSNTLQALLQTADQSHAALYGSTIVYEEKQDIIQCAGGCFYNPLTTIFHPYLANTSIHDALHDAGKTDFDYIFGASFFVRTEVFSQCGLLNDSYFLFYEEIDFCRRAKKAGYSLKWCKESIIRHKGSSSVGKPDSGNKVKRKLACYHENLSTLLFTKHFYPWLLPPAMFFRFCGKLTLLVLRRDYYLIPSLCSAFIHFLRGKNLRGNIGN